MGTVDGYGYDGQQKDAIKFVTFVDDSKHMQSPVFCWFWLIGLFMSCSDA